MITLQTFANGESYSSIRTKINANFQALINYVDKPGIVDADIVLGSDSVTPFGLVSYSWTNIKAFLKGYFDTFYATLASPIFTGKPVISGRDVIGAIYTPATGSQTVTIDCASNNMHIVNCHASGTAITFAINNATNNQPFIISVTQGGTTLSTIAGFFATIRWVGGTVPIFTATLNKRDVFGFIRTGTNTYDGFIIGQNI